MTLIRSDGMLFPPPSLQLHEFDDLRFDIRVHDCTYFFRASSREEKAFWTDVVEGNKVSLRERRTNSATRVAKCSLIDPLLFTPFLTLSLSAPLFLSPSLFLYLSLSPLPSLLPFQRYLAETGFSMGTIRRQGSILSLSTISQASSSSFKVSWQGQSHGDTAARCSHVCFCSTHTHSLSPIIVLFCTLWLMQNFGAECLWIFSALLCVFV